MAGSWTVRRDCMIQFKISHFVMYYVGEVPVNTASLNQCSPYSTHSVVNKYGGMWNPFPRPPTAHCPRRRNGPMNNVCATVFRPAPTGPTRIFSYLYILQHSAKQSYYTTNISIGFYSHVMYVRGMHEVLVIILGGAPHTRT